MSSFDKIPPPQNTSLVLCKLPPPSTDDDSAPQVGNPPEPRVPVSVMAEFEPAPVRQVMQDAPLPDYKAPERSMVSRARTGLDKWARIVLDHVRPRSDLALDNDVFHSVVAPYLGNSLIRLTTGREKVFEPRDFHQLWDTPPRDNPRLAPMDPGDIIDNRGIVGIGSPVICYAFKNPRVFLFMGVLDTSSPMHDVLVLRSHCGPATGNRFEPLHACTASPDGHGYFFYVGRNEHLTVFVPRDGSPWPDPYLDNKALLGCAQGDRLLVQPAITMEDGQTVHAGAPLSCILLDRPRQDGDGIMLRVRAPWAPPHRVSGERGDLQAPKGREVDTSRDGKEARYKFVPSPTWNLLPGETMLLESVGEVVPQSSDDFTVGQGPADNGLLGQPPHFGVFEFTLRLPKDPKAPTRPLVLMDTYFNFGQAEAESLERLVNGPV